MHIHDTEAHTLYIDTNKIAYGYNINYRNSCINMTSLPYG